MGQSFKTLWIRQELIDNRLKVVMFRLFLNIRVHIRYHLPAMISVGAGVRSRARDGDIEAAEASSIFYRDWTLDRSFQRGILCGHCLLIVIHFTTLVNT